MSDQWIVEALESDIKEYNRLAHIHRTKVDDTFSEHSARKRKMADIAHKYEMSSHQFMYAKKISIKG